MISESFDQISNQRIPRRTLLAILESALDSGLYRFARQTALAWLGVYPGDIQVNLYLAKAMIAEGKVSQAVPILEKIVKQDPEYIDAYVELRNIYESTNPEKLLYVRGCLHAMGLPGDSRDLPDWSKQLDLAREPMKTGSFQEAEKHIQMALAAMPELPLAAVMNLQIMSRKGDAAATRRLAEIYHACYPDCLSISLILAETQIDLRQEPEAVRLLHYCVANDISGQVPERIWGKDHPFKPLWPETPDMVYDLPVPAEVSARLGWNQLPPGEPIENNTSLAETQKDLSEHVEDLYDPGANPEISPVEVTRKIKVDVVQSEPEGTTCQMALKNDPQQRSSQAVNESLKAVMDEFERLAKRLRKTAIVRSDGRFQIYVIFSSMVGLSSQYGPQTAAVIVEEMRNLATAIRKKPYWGSLVFCPDDPEICKQLGMTPLDNNDPWKLKLALADLDQILGKKGEMIGSLLIVGGPQVVPFHNLPNPIDDLDAQVPSDNPYGTLDGNYFVPEWPVGRLVGEDGTDAGLLLEQIRLITQRYDRLVKTKGIKKSLAPSFSDFLQYLIRLLGQSNRKYDKNCLGFTAAVWQKSSKAVYKMIGDPEKVLNSPPEISGSLDTSKLGGMKLQFFNLHGVDDAPEWFGQRDPADPAGGPDYPIAITPADLKKNGSAPRVVFTEACYGGHVLRKKVDQSIVLKYLSLGTQAFVGSTCVSYGSVDVPLIGADLLGEFFWKHVKAGEPVGMGLMQAKMELVREMNRRQGYLDPEDQKTLISFVLYGDPLLVYEDPTSFPKHIRRLKFHPMIKTISDQKVDDSANEVVSSDTIAIAKRLVEAYLPGMENADVCVSQQIPGLAASLAVQGTTNPASQTKQGSPFDAERVVITLRKQVRQAKRIHKHIARVTMDQRGNMIKLVISR
ncbi:MAG TPA: hypothetical protein VIO61_12045 [Anaerolineaceae bacterium]